MSSLTPYKGLLLQDTGSNNNTWGTVNNTSVVTLIDSMMGGITTVSLSSSNVTLSGTQNQTAILRFTGPLTASVTVTCSIQGFVLVENYTTGFFSVTLTTGVGASVLVPQYQGRTVIADATNGLRAVGLDPPGTVINYGANAAPLHPSLTGEFVLPYGQNISRTTYANLFATIGTLYGAGDGSTTFGVPDLRGRTTAGVDNMGGAAAGRITQFTGLGATGGEELHTLTIGEMPSHNHGGVTGDDSPDHTHGITGTTIVNNANSSAGPPYQVSGTTQTGGASVRHQHSIASQGGSVAHNTAQPTLLCNYLLKV